MNEQQEQWNPNNCICKPYLYRGNGFENLSGMEPPPGTWFVKDPKPDCPERGKEGHPQID